MCRITFGLLSISVPSGLAASQRATDFYNRGCFIMYSHFSILPMWAAARHLRGVLRWRRQAAPTAPAPYTEVFLLCSYMKIPSPAMGFPFHCWSSLSRPLQCLPQKDCTAWSCCQRRLLALAIYQIKNRISKRLYKNPGLQKPTLSIMS